MSKQYEHQALFTQLSLHINEYERIAIIGNNGCGKSTLLNIIAQKVAFDSGKYSIQHNINVAYLPQKPVFQEGVSVKDSIRKQLKILDDAKREIEQLQAKAETFENKDLLKRYNELVQLLEHHNAWDIENKIERILQAFKLKEYEHTPSNLLSGGEQKRVALAGLLLFKPDVLLLDEPTNHLDGEMVEFLEEWILKEKYTLVFISHDRYFIDTIATKIAEISNKELHCFNGGYRDYLKAKEELLKALHKEHEQLLKLLKNEEEWLSKGVQARRKRNEGRKQRLLELRASAKKNPSILSTMKLQLQREQKHFHRPISINRQKMLFELDNVTLKMGHKELIQGLNLRIVQKDRIAIVGRNGSGKSSFLKMLIGEIIPTQGIIKKGDIKIGYFDQHRSRLDDSKNIIETFCPFGGDRVNVKGKNIHVYGYLKNFLFPKEHLDKKIGVLSGGEKSRLALALLFTQEYECLILDEPTNDLDIATMGVLEEYLLSFQGALLFVSHDRYFTDKVADNLLVFNGYGEVTPSCKQFSAFLDEQKELFAYEEMQEVLKKDIEHKAYKSIIPKKAHKLSYNEERELQNLPQEIENIQLQIKKLEIELSSDNSQKDWKKLSEEYQALQQKASEKLDYYIYLEEKKESFQKGIN